MRAGAYIPEENMTAVLIVLCPLQKTSKNHHDFGQNSDQTHERSEKAQLKGQIWTKHACKMRGQLPSSQYFHGHTPP